MGIRFKKVCIILLMISNFAYAKTNVDNQAKIIFWNKQQKGTNIFNQSVSKDDIKAAKKYGIKFVRLAPDKFTSTHRDFLIGNADSYSGLVKEDLTKLKKTLDMCEQEKMPVVITMLSLPGSRWKKNNKDKDDLRIWKEKKFRKQAELFWKDLATELKDHPAIVGYNILNEPHPEKIYPSKDIHINLHQAEVQAKLHNFYKQMIKSIRSIDQHTPIILDSSAYADSKTFEKLKPHKDKNILYSFHMYEPYEYTNHKLNKGKFHYPGNIAGKIWNKEELKKYMGSVVRFQQSYKIPSSKILVGEFGGHRMAPGLAQYFKDLTDIFADEGWHYAFYAFREDVWDGMDYELGHKKLDWAYWKAVEKGKPPSLERKDSHAAFSVLKKALSD